MYGDITAGSTRYFTIGKYGDKDWRQMAKMIQSIQHSKSAQTYTTRTTKSLSTIQQPCIKTVNKCKAHTLVQMIVNCISTFKIWLKPEWGYDKSIPIAKVTAGLI